MDNKGNEDEYQFVEPGEPTASAAATPSSFDQTESRVAHIFENIRREHVFAALGVIIVVLCVFKLGSVIINSVRHRAQAQQAALAAAANVPSPVTVSDTRMSGVEENISGVSDKLSQQQDAMVRVEGALNNLQTQVTNINNTLQYLSSQITAQQAEAAATAAKAKPKLPPRKTVVQAKPLVYYVKAVIPGRAWLQATDGTTKTVSVGDAIAGRGVVTSIDAAQGIVTMSGGSVLHFSPADS